MLLSILQNIPKIYAIKFLRGMMFISAVLVPFFTEWGQLTFTQIMVLQSWFMLWIFLLEVPTGTVADRWSRKSSLVLSGLATIIGVVAYSIQANFLLFLIGEFLFALGAALGSGADESLIYDSLRQVGREKDAKKVFSRAEIFKLVGLIAGALIGSLIAKYLGVRFTMLLSLIPFSFGLVVSLALKEPKIQETEDTTKNYLDILRTGLKFFAHHRVVKILTLDLVAIASISYFIVWVYQPILIKLGVDIKYFGVVHSLMVLGQIGVLNFFGKFEKFLGSQKRWLFFSALLTGLSFVILSATNYLPVVVVCIFLAASLGLSRRPLIISYINKYLPSAQRATILSSVSMMRTLVLVIFNPLVGWFVDWSLALTLLSLGVVAVGFSLFSKIEEEMLLD